MLGAIKYNLSHLTDFSGRDARQTFWYYMLFLVVSWFLAALVAAIPMYIDMFTAAFDAAQSGAGADRTEAVMLGGVNDSLEQQMWFGMAIMTVMTFLFVAAFVRRLHDAGFSGWWALIPVVTQLVGVWVSYQSLELIEEAMTEAMAGNSTAMMAAQSEMLAYSLVSYLGYIVVIIFGVMKSKGPNQYGDEPVSF